MDEHSTKYWQPGGSVFMGSSVAISFSGTGITWIGKKGPNFGIASWSIDGGPETDVDNYNPVELSQNPNVVVSDLAQGSHVLRISLTAATNGTDHWQTIDAFQIAGTPLTFSQGVAGCRFSQGVVAGCAQFPSLISGSSWQGGCAPGGGDGTDLSGGHYWDGNPNDSVSWTFNGSLIEVYGRPDFENGGMNAFIDGSLVTTISLRFGEADIDTNNSALLFSRKLSSGEHTIKLSPTGSGDGGPNRNLIQIDQFVAFP